MFLLKVVFNTLFFSGHSLAMVLNKKKKRKKKQPLGTPYLSSFYPFSFIAHICLLLIPVVLNLN